MYAPQTYPSLGGGQLAPQGFVGQPQIGSQLGQALGSLGHLLPFQAAPGISPALWGGQPTYGGWGGQPWYGGGQLAPQGFVGNLLGQLAGPAGQAFGGLFGQPHIGQALGGLGHFLPFQAVPIPVQVGLVPPYVGSPLPFQAMPLPMQVGLPGGIVPPYLGSPLPFQPVPGIAPMVA